MVAKLAAQTGLKRKITIGGRQTNADNGATFRVILRGQGKIICAGDKRNLRFLGVVLKDSPVSQKIS